MPETPRDDAIDALDDLDRQWRRPDAWRSLSRRTRRPADLDDAPRNAARASLPARVRAWLESLRASWRSGEVLFVHAGVNPQVELEAFLAVPWNIPLDKLDEDRHWAWVRWPFLEHRPGKGGFSGLFVVHGHTPTTPAAIPRTRTRSRGFRLNLDAGSAMTGVAKMAVIRGRDAEVVIASGPTNRELMRRTGIRSARGDSHADAGVITRCCRNTREPHE